MKDENRKIEIMAGIAGIVSAILMVAGPMSTNEPDSGQTAKWVQYLSSSGNRAEMIVSGYLWVVAGLALIVLIAGAYRRFTGYTGITSMCATVAGIAAIIFATILMVGGVTRASIAGDIAFGGATVPTSGDLIEHITGLGAALVVLPGGLSAALALAAIAVVIMREHGPRWLAILGFIAAICGVFGVLFFPMAGVAIWVLVASIVLLRSRATAPALQPARAT